MNNTKQNIWQNLAEFGKTILAHVNINYDGSTGAIHIDILPTEFQSGKYNEHCSEISHNSSPVMIADQTDTSETH